MPPGPASGDLPRATALVRRRWATAAAGFALGAPAFLAFAPTRAFWLLPVLLGTLVWLGLRAQNWRRAWWLGFWFGLGYFLCGVGWVYVSMHDFGGMPVPVAAFATALFCAYLALYPAAATAVLALPGRATGWRAAWMFPALWAVSEWLRGWVFTGFPWLAAGYSQVPDGPFGHFAPVLGVYGVSWLTALVAGCLGWLAHDWRRRPAASWALALLIMAAGASLRPVDWTRPAGAPVAVTLLQGNIEQSLKWRPEHARATLDTYRDMTLAARTRLILLPETALPLFDRDVPPDYLAELAGHARSLGGDVLLGIPQFVSQDEYYNSVISLGGAPAQAYRKYHLVPFGDYFPRWGPLTWLMRTLQIPMSSFSRGAPRQAPLAVAGQKVAVNICYEDVFGEEIIRQLPEATLLANFTNDAWWGRSAAADQHMQISQMRARETGRALLRATNTGVTAIIDARGHTRGVLPQFTQAALTGAVQGMTGSTPFIRWGNGAFLIIVAVLLIGAALRGRVPQGRTD